MLTEDTRGETIRPYCVLHLSVLQYIAILQYFIGFWLEVISYRNMGFSSKVKNIHPV